MSIESISPKYIKSLNIKQLQQLCDDIRKFLIENGNKFGGHIGPNLGVVELSVAMHYVFDSPKDKFVFDVSHQSYVHQIITGRNPYEKFKFGANSSYSNTLESPHDHFNMGHTSTSVSLASGLAKGRDILNEKYNVVAFIGDGALSGGEAFEGLDYAATLKSNFIVIFNDNEWSNIENSGGLFDEIKLLRKTNGEYKNNYFKSLGYDYLYIDKGNNLEELIEKLKQAKNLSKPIVMHIHTKKGNGLVDALNDPAKYHNIQLAIGVHSKDAANYGSVTTQFLEEKMKIDKKVTPIIAGTPILGIDWIKSHNTRVIDVGIAEENAIALGSGLAKAGVKPFICLEATFLQRAYDQIIIDWTLNNTPAVLVIQGGGALQQDATHNGIFDIAMLRHIPNLTLLSPTCLYEHKQMLEWAFKQSYPVAIRISRAYRPSIERKTSDIELYKSEVVKRGSTVAIFGLGIFLDIAFELAIELEKNGINPTIINPRFISHLDEELFVNLENEHSVIVTIENGVKEGGWGQSVASFYGPRESKMRVLNLGLKNEYYNWVKHDEQLDRAGITVQNICSKIVHMYSMVK